MDCSCLAERPLLVEISLLLLIQKESWRRLEEGELRGIPWAFAVLCQVL